MKPSETGLAKLTKAQRRMLEIVARESLADGTGQGTFLYTHNDRRVANNLERQGLVCVGVIHTKITPAGRIALQAGDKS